MSLNKLMAVLLVFFIFLSCEKQSIKKPQQDEKRETVKVAAVQCYSRMGDKDYNFKLISSLVKNAVEKGAKIVVLPEAAVSGYMNPAKNVTWTTGESSQEEIAVQNTAESIEGEYIQKYLELARQYKIYLTVPFIEEDSSKFYNSVLLASPEGKVLGHHRKNSLWTHGDSGWCSIGEAAPQVVDTEYGRLGLMICYDAHSMPEKLVALKADIVLYSVGWYGPNTEDWYKRRFPEKYVVKNNFSVIAANWSFEKGQEGWEGAGWSNVVYRNGIVIKITDKVEGNEIVIADLPLN